jgi:hypothetical protein
LSGPLADAIDIGRHVIPIVREEVAKRDAAKTVAAPSRRLSLIRGGARDPGRAGISLAGLLCTARSAMLTGKVPARREGVAWILGTRSCSSR